MSDKGVDETKPRVPVSREALAVARLQRVWRLKFSRTLTRLHAVEFLKPGVGVTMEHVRSIRYAFFYFQSVIFFQCDLAPPVRSFEELVVHLREKPVIAATKSILMRIHHLSTLRHGSPRLAVAPERVNVRVFLAAYMIALRPTHVFEAMGSLEQSLFEAALPLLNTFQRIVERVASAGSFQGVASDLSCDFPTTLLEYLKRFKEWKVPDEAKLTCRIKHALIALYNAQQHLPPDEPEDSKLKVEFRTQIERLRAKLQQIAGADALAEFDANHTVHSACAGGCNALSSYATMSGRMTNEQLAHELLLYPAFQLDESGGSEVENPVYHRIRESFHQAFWNSLVDDLRLPTPCYVRVLRVLSEVRDGISDLAGAPESASVKETLDIDFIRRQVESGAYDWDSCKRLVGGVVSIIRRVQAPKRDEETAQQWRKVGSSMLCAEEADRPGVTCKALEFLLDRINAMRIDAANAR